MNHDAMLNHYIAAALWSESIGEDFSAAWSAKTGEDPAAPDVSLESFGFTADDLAPEAREQTRADVVEFATANAADLAELSAEQAGLDFWLTRNGHGAGFWDRGLGDVGQRLTDAAHAFGASYLYVGDDLETVHVA